MLPFYTALAETGAGIAVLNARALHRAGLLTANELAAMHKLLLALEEQAAVPEQVEFVESLRRSLQESDSR